MKTTQRTVLITGGSAGIGLETAKLFLAKGNRVIITGRNEDRLQQALQQLPGATGITSDITLEADVNRLAERITKDFPELDLLVNNAGQAFVHAPSAAPDTFEKAGAEMLTNYLSVIRLTERLLPVLKRQQEPAVVNVSSIVVFAPSRTLSTYAASKAALHSYTQTLRLSLAQDGVKVFELMPPLVNTEFSKEIGGEKGIPPHVVAESLLDGLEKDTPEIHVGQTADLYRLFLSSPQDALNRMNEIS